jgi:hypothetical protein
MEASNGRLARVGVLGPTRATRPSVRVRPAKRTCKHHDIVPFADQIDMAEFKKKIEPAVERPGPVPPGDEVIIGPDPLPGLMHLYREPLGKLIPMSSAPCFARSSPHERAGRRPDAPGPVALPPRPGPGAMKSGAPYRILNNSAGRRILFSWRR